MSSTRTPCQDSKTKPEPYHDPNPPHIRGILTTKTVMFPSILSASPYDESAVKKISGVRQLQDQKPPRSQVVRDGAECRHRPAGVRQSTG